MARSVNQLITFPPSVDSETTRLILAYHREEPVEVRQSAVGSGLRAIWHRAKIPILLRDELTLSPSLSIAKYLDEQVDLSLRLTGATGDEAAKIEGYWGELHHEMGTWVAQWSYDFILSDRQLALGLLGSGAPPWQTTLDRALFPLVRWGMRRGLKGLNREVAVTARAECRRVFVNVAADLKRSGDYLVGQRLTLADIGFAACAAPIMLSELYQGAIPSFPEASDEMREFALELRDHPAGRHADRVYRELTYR